MSKTQIFYQKVVHEEVHGILHYILPQSNTKVLCVHIHLANKFSYGLFTCSMHVSDLSQSCVEVMGNSDDSAIMEITPDGLLNEVIGF